MRASTFIMVGFAVVFGLIAVFLAQTWLNRQSEARLRSLEANAKKPVAARTIVVASRPLRFGVELSASALREVEWASETMPAGAFTTVNDVVGAGRRVVLASFEANEPILASKITGAGQRATLAAMLAEGMKAVSIRVNDVEGVAGFVLPGERVDVVLTRQLEKNAAYTDVVMQNARVLAIDQLADDRSDKPAVARSVTLEVDIAGAQKLALASQVGTLSLLLRRAGETRAQETRRVNASELGDAEIAGPPAEQRRFSSINVVRAGGKSTSYSVPRETTESVDLARAAAQ